MVPEKNKKNNDRLLDGGDPLYLLSPEFQRLLWLMYQYATTDNLCVVYTGPSPAIDINSRLAGDAANGWDPCANAGAAFAPQINHAVGQPAAESSPGFQRGGKQDATGIGTMGNMLSVSMLIPYIYPSGVMQSNIPAWSVTNQWNENVISQYRQFASTQAKMYLNNGARFTCEDLALRILIDFASTNNLPLLIVNPTRTFSPTIGKWSGVDDFANQVLGTTAASHLQNSANTIDMDISSIEPGDLLLQVENGRAHHVQFVTSTSWAYIWIVQGDSQRSFFRRTGYPQSIFGYIGQPLNESFYQIAGGLYYSGHSHQLYLHANILYTQYVGKRWNFYNFNKGFQK